MRFSALLLLAISATLTLAQEAVVSKAILIGEDKTDKDAIGASVYAHSTNHQTATASIVKHASLMVKFEPCAQSPSQLAKTFEQFEQKLTKFPGFKDKVREYLDIHLDGSLDDLQRKIKDKYNPHREVSIAKVLRELVPENNRNNARLKHWGLSVQTIDRNMLGHVKIRLITLRLRLEMDRNSGKVDVPEQHARLYVDELEIDREYLKNHADRLAARIEKTTTEQWARYFTSKPVGKSDSWFESQNQLPFDF